MVNKVVKYKDREYELKYPRVGQFIDLRVREQQLSRGTSKDLVLGIGADIDSYIYITTVAHIEILLPELVKDLKAPILEMGVIDFQDLVDLYTNEIAPWLDEWKKKITERIQTKSE